ncbi:thiazole synthase [Reinekea blandensis]|uniref:Thiazole synthase n=1 Tax=Reinekea blandensis MED297 TaxID=314283 RepID=A4BCN6_9GAMM|nr:thiazole synthase [Reinekea blandensis]EAR09968.1 thiazole synthase [Reinekea sp. MED297] [Reinekea blandensis MED297]
MTPFRIYDRTYQTRLLLGTARYPSPAILQQAVTGSGAELVTVSLRRQQSAPESAQPFWTLLRKLNVDLLPNTAGCRTADEAFTLAQMSRELFDTPLIKLEVIGDDQTLQPDMVQTLACARRLLDDGFQVLPYCTDDLMFCRALVEAGCEVIMPWGAPIGTGRGLSDPYRLRTLRERLPDVTLIVDAGLGKPSHVTEAMELGADAVLLNTAIAKAHDPVAMAQACRLATEAGLLGAQAGPMLAQDHANPSTPVLGMPFRRTS